MLLTRDSYPQDIHGLKRGLRLLDKTLNDAKAGLVAKIILAGKMTVSIEELANILETVEEDDKGFDPNWFKNTLHRIKLYLNNLDEPRKLRKMFEVDDNILFLILQCWIEITNNLCLYYNYKYYFIVNKD